MSRRTVLPALLSLAISSPAFAQGGAALPPARQLIDKHIVAIGGKEKILAHKSVRVVGAMEMPSQGVRGELEIKSAKPNLMYSKVSVPGLGEFVSGFDGTVGWQVNPMQGPRLLAGAELDMAREQADPANELRPAEKLTSAETVEKTSMGGQECYKVKLVWKTGRESHDCYSVQSGLLVGMVQRQDSPMGSIEIPTVLSDYKDFGGVKRYTKMTQEIMGQQQVMTITTVEYDQVEPAAFALPKEIQALVEQQKSAKPAEKKPESR